MKDSFELILNAEFYVCYHDHRHIYIYIYVSEVVCVNVIQRPVNIVLSV